MRTSRQRIHSRICAVLALFLLLTSLFGCSGTHGKDEPVKVTPERIQEEFSTKTAAVRAFLFSDSPETSSEDPVSLAFTFCDGETQGKVLFAQGPDLANTFTALETNALAFLLEKLCYPKWFKVDIVSFTEEITKEELTESIRKCKEGFFRYGISFTKDFSCALLESELNSNGLIDYESDALDLSALNAYLNSQGKQTISEIPDTLFLFSCEGLFCDEDRTVYPLYDDPVNYGRRKTGNVLPELAKTVSITATDYLFDSIRDDGSYLYGYFPVTDRNNTAYNLLRHAGTTWSLLCRYRILPEEDTFTRYSKEECKKKIQSALSFLLRPSTEGGPCLLYDADTAYLIEPGSDEIKAGANGLAIIALTEYLSLFGPEDDAYAEYSLAVRRLSNGLCSMQDAQTGVFTHVLRAPTLETIDEFRTVFYDGEATFALARAYALTEDAKYLEAAEQSVLRMIRDRYEKYSDHWVAYALNEITKYETDTELLLSFYRFSLVNVQTNLYKISSARTTSHIYSELLMMSFETYRRMLASGIDPLSLYRTFDESMFIETIFARQDFLLTGYGYPEYAMYFKNPARVVGSFFIRQDRFRIRIDDNQHFVGSFLRYLEHYDELRVYAEKYQLEP